MLKAAVSLEVSPRLSAPDAIGDAMFSNQSVDGMGEGTPEVLVPKEETRLKATHEKFRFGLDKDIHGLDCSLFVPPQRHGQGSLF